MSLQARTVDEFVAGRREEDRISVGRACVLRAAGRPPVHSALLDLTRHGCRIRTGHPLAVGESVRLGLAGVGTIEASVVWSEGTQYGCEFIGSLRPGAVSDATRGNVVNFDVSPAAKPFKWSPRQRVLTLAAYALTPWLAIGAAVLLFRAH